METLNYTKNKQVKDLLERFEKLATEERSQFLNEIQQHKGVRSGTMDQKDGRDITKSGNISPERGNTSHQNEPSVGGYQKQPRTSEIV